MTPPPPGSSTFPGDAPKKNGFWIFQKPSFCEVSKSTDIESWGNRTTAMTHSLWFDTIKNSSYKQADKHFFRKFLNDSMIDNDNGVQFEILIQQWTFWSISSGCCIELQNSNKSDRPLFKCKNGKAFGNWSKKLLNKNVNEPRVVKCQAYKEWEWNFNLRQHYKCEHTETHMSTVLEISSGTQFQIMRKCMRKCMRKYMRKILTWENSWENVWENAWEKF